MQLPHIVPELSGRPFSRDGRVHQEKVGSCKGRGRLRTFYHMHFILSPCVRLYLGRNHSRDAGPLYIMPVSCNDRTNFVLIVVYQSKIGQTHYLR